MIAPMGPDPPPLVPLATVAAMPTTQPVRTATDADLDPLSETLARAFLDDPVMEWLVPPRGREARLRRFFRVTAASDLRHGHVYTTAAHAGGALWLPPGRWKTETAQIIRQAPAMLRILGTRLLTALGGLGAVEKVHPREKHYYLSVLGTDPAHQGTGVGGALIDVVLRRCDAERTGAYLESSKPDNVPYYERFGFRVTGEVQLPKGPLVWTMWRDPDPDAGR